MSRSKNHFEVKILWLLGLLFSLSAVAENGMLKDRIRIQKRSYVSGGSSQTEEYVAQKQELLNSKRKGLILDIKRFLAEARSVDQKTELNLRLAGLYLEDYHAGLFKAQAEYEKVAAIYQKGDKKGRAPQLDTSEPIASLDKARSVYKSLAKLFPNHPRHDEMIYFLAITSMDRGKPQEAIAYFRQLTQEHPQSRYAMDAVLQVGEHYFENNDFNNAEKYFDTIIGRKHRPLITYAIYKKAWCEYNLSRTSAALGHFKWVVENDEKVQGGGSPSRLRNEAMRDITLPFVDLRLADQGIEFFKAQGDPHYRNGVEMMAQLFFEAGEYKSALKLYGLLLHIDPNNAKNPGYEISMVEALRLSNNARLAVDRLFSRMPVYLTNSNWYEINSTNPSVIKEASKLFEETALKYAMQFHAEAQKMKNDDMYEVSKQLYAKYLDAFPQASQAPKIRFYLAEILYKQERFPEAAQHYYVVYKHPAAGLLKADSIRYALTALDRKLNIDRKKAGLAEINSKSDGKLKAQADDSTILPYSEAESRFIEIAAEFLSVYATAKEAPDVMFETAYLQYVHRDFEKAVQGFYEILAKYSKHPTAYTAANMTLDILNRGENYAVLIAACQKFLKHPDLTRPAFHEEVANVLRLSELKRISIVEKDGDFKKAAAEYIDYTKAYGPQDESLFEKALYNASANFTKAGMFLEAVETQERFLRRFPKSNYQENMLLEVAKAYETMAKFDKAAPYFEQFATQHPQHPQAKNALRLAGIYYWGSGSVGKAEKMMLSYLATYPNDAKAVEKDLLDLYDSASAYEKLIAFYQKARSVKGITHSEQLAHLLKIAQIYSKRGGRVPPALMQEALLTVSKTKTTLSESPRGIESMSQTLFWAANQREAAFYSVKLILPQATLQKNMQKKLQMLKELEKEYLHIASLGSGEWGLGSIYRAAAAYQHVAAEISAAPVPAELSATELDQYRAEIKKQMLDPFREKAMGLAVQCLDKSQEFILLSGWTARCYELASELDSQRYPHVRTFYLPPVQLALLLPGRESKIPLGSLKNFNYPFYSSALFADRKERSLASITAFSSGAPAPSDSVRGAVPGLLTYRSISAERRKILAKEFNQEGEQNPQKISFSSVNVLRLLNPKRALPVLMAQIEYDPTNIALHNMLALTYLEMGDTSAAKVTLLSLMARGAKNSVVTNNLGVIMMMEGKEAAAIELFNQASALDAPSQALLNLGYIALKYRNGFEAKRYFERAVEIDGNDVTAQTGLAVAKIQNRQMIEGREGLVGSVKRFKSDPYSRVAIGYYLMDVEKQHAMANRLFNDYMQGQTSDGDSLLREALHEAKSQTNSASVEGSLVDGPELE